MKKMSTVVATNTNNNVVTSRCSSNKQENDQLSHHHHHQHHNNHHHHQHQHQNRCLHEKCSNRQIVVHHRNQNSDPDSPIKKSVETHSNAFDGSCRLPDLDSSVSSCMRLDSFDSVILESREPPGAATDTGVTPTHCHCLSQLQPTVAAAATASSQGEPSKTLETGSSTSNCPPVIKSKCHNTTTTTTYNNNNQKGIKRPNESQQQQIGQAPAVAISSAGPHPPHPTLGYHVVSPGLSNNLAPLGSGSHLKLPAEGQAQDGDNDEEEEGDFMDEDDTAFDYEPVLIKILNEKKLVLSNSPDVIKFLAGLRELQHHQKQTN